MLTPAELWRRLRRGDDDFNAELRAHIALETDRLIAEGWSPRNAALEARRRFGNITVAQEQRYDSRRPALIDDAARDVRYAIRTLARDKAYVFAAVAALGIGLAANIALFSLFSSVALRPLPVPNPQRIVSIYQNSARARFGNFTIGDALFYRDHAKSVAIALQQPSHLRLAGIPAGPAAALAPSASTVAEPVIALFVTANFFDTFGVHAIAGHGFAPEDDRSIGSAGTYPALISDNYYERRFGRDPSVIGSTLLVSGIRAQVVGVSPRDFAGTRQEVPDLYIPLSALGDYATRATKEKSACCEIIGRLASNATLDRARPELALLASQHALELPPASRQFTLIVQPALAFGRLGETIKPLFVALQVAMALVLLIACANVAGVMLGRAAAREREIAVRLATGASRKRLVRQLVTEGVVVALVAGVLAAMVTLYTLATGSRLLAGVLSHDGGGTLALNVEPTSGVFVYVAVVSICSGIAFALMPALQASRPELAAALKTTVGSSSGPRARRLRGWLVAGQIAFSIGLLVAAAGFARSASDLVAADPGFDPSSVVSIWLSNPQELGLPAAQARQIEQNVRARIQAAAGFTVDAVASRVPLGGNVSMTPVLTAAAAADPGNRDAARPTPFARISENYFTTLAIRLTRGRAFSAAEVRDSAAVAIVSDSLARRLWGNADPIGQRIAFGGGQGQSNSALPLGDAVVVGTVADVRGLSMTAADPGDLYLPGLTNEWSSRILVRTRAGAQLIRDLPGIVHGIEPALPVFAEPLATVVANDGSVVTARIAAGVLAAVGLIGLLLASVGVYGTVSYAVRQRRRDIGIRMALGASTRQLLGTILGDLTGWIAGGVVAGIVLGAVAIQLTNATLPGILGASGLRATTLLAVPVPIAALVLLAALLSARKATLTNPSIVLREDA